MANQKGTLHSVPLKTMSLNLNRFNADIAPYEGFNKNNSPFFGNVLSPFYKANVQGLGSETYVAKDGFIYYYGNYGNFYLKSGKEDKLINNLSGENFLLKEEIYNSGNETYSTILGFVSYPKGYVSTEDSSIALCSDREGNLNLIHTSGSLRGQPFKENVIHSSEEACKIKPGEKIHYIRALLGASNNRIEVLVCLDNRVIILYGTDSTKVDVLKNISNAYKENQSFFYTGDTNYPYYFTTVYGTYNISDASFLSKSPLSKSIKLVTDDSLTTTVTTNNLTLSKIMIDYNGNVSFYGSEYKIRQANGQWRVCETGVVRGYESNGTLVINVKGYSLLGDVSRLSVELLDSNNFSPYCSDVVVGIKMDSYTKVTPGTWKVTKVPVMEPVLVPVGRYDNSVNAWVVEHKYVDKIVTYKTVKEYTGDVKTEVPGSYYIKLLDTQRLRTWESIPISSEGHFQGGLMTTIDDTFRVLYHGGVLQAVSIADDAETIGTLICGMSEIDDTSPISYKKTVRSSDNVAYAELYYKDSDSWVRVTVAPTPESLAVGNDPIKPNFKRTFQILNDRYILLNTSVYYNCFDTIDKKWYHFASDYNDRCIFTFTVSWDRIPQTLAEYLSNCENWYFATAQGANYEALNRPFISTLFPPYVSAVPKKNFRMTETVIQACYTPDEEDVDIYRGKQVDVGNVPGYLYSQTGLIGGGSSANNASTNYQNQKLVDTNYAFSFTLIPSIFAKFISGFINQGIIIDNNHSYLQVFANTTKPIFAINFVSQLEGVEAAFIIQGQYFVIINGSIYRYDSSTSTISAVINIGDMILLGYTPYQALFFSKTNRTVYTFVGDNTLSLLVQADEIEQIYSSVYNPNTCSIYVLASSGIYIFGSDQLLRLDITGYTRGYPLGLGAAFVSDTDTMFISYTRDNKPAWVQSDMKRIPIELETKFYGEGNNIKSVNDCVYIRLYDENKCAGKVTLKCQTLNEGTWVSEEKTFDISSEMWDKVHKTLFLRYQPKYQEGAGFSVSIKSPFCIASLDISETPQTVQNSKNNA